MSISLQLMMLITMSVGTLAVNQMGSFVSQNDKYSKCSKYLDTVMFPINAIDYWTSVVKLMTSIIKTEF